MPDFPWVLLVTIVGLAVALFAAIAGQSQG